MQFTQPFVICFSSSTFTARRPFKKMDNNFEDNQDWSPKFSPNEQECINHLESLPDNDNEFENEKAIYDRKLWNHFQSCALDIAQLYKCTYSLCLVFSTKDFLPFLSIQITLLPNITYGTHFSKRPPTLPASSKSAPSFKGKCLTLAARAVTTAEPRSCSHGPKRRRVTFDVRNCFPFLADVHILQTTT